MTAKNDITGDLIKTGAPSKEYMEGYQSIFGNARVQRGRYRQDRETGEFIPIQQWLQKYGEAPKPRGPLISVKQFEAFESPTTGRVISSYRDLDRDMKESGCREYEGFANEKREADKYLQEKDRRMEAIISESVEQTAYEIEHGYITPSENPVCNFTFGDD